MGALRRLSILSSALATGLPVGDAKQLVQHHFFCFALFLLFFHFSPHKIFLLSLLSSSPVPTKEQRGEACKHLHDAQLPTRFIPQQGLFPSQPTYSEISSLSSLNHSQVPGIDVYIVGAGMQHLTIAVLMQKIHNIWQAEGQSCNLTACRCRKYLIHALLSVAIRNWYLKTGFTLLFAFIIPD